MRLFRLDGLFCRDLYRHDPTFSAQEEKALTLGRIASIPDDAVIDRLDINEAIDGDGGCAVNIAIAWHPRR